MRLPSRDNLNRLPPGDAAVILAAQERELEGLLVRDVAAMDHRSRAYHRQLIRRKLERIAEIRRAIGIG
jgi:hypothetical protein